MTHYDVLGLDRAATPAQIKEAYRRLVVVSHSDRLGDEDLMRAVIAAYKVLSDPELRAAYDAELPAPPSLREQLAALRAATGVIADDLGAALEQLERAGASAGRAWRRLRNFWRRQAR